MAILQIYVDEVIKAKVEKRAAKEERSISYLCRKWIEEGLERQKETKVSTDQPQAVSK